MRILLAFVLLLAACGASTEARTRTALDVIARAIDPAYAASAAECDARQKAVIRASGAGSIDPARAWAELEEIADRCFKAHAAFDAVKRLHDQAVELLESGKVEEARALLEQLQDAWRKLNDSAITQVGNSAGGS